MSLPKADFTQFTPLSYEGHTQIIALMEHVASGAESVWSVMDDSRSYGQFKTYQEANEQFESLPDGRHASLHLYTRVGTSVVFRYKE